MTQAALSYAKDSSALRIAALMSGSVLRREVLYVHIYPWPPPSTNAARRN